MFLMCEINAGFNTLSEMEIPGVIKPNLSCKPGPLTKPILAMGQGTDCMSSPIILIHVLSSFKSLF